MLKSELIRARLKIRNNQVWTEAIPSTYYYLNMANDLINLFHQHVGHSRGHIAYVLREYEGDSLDYPIIRGLAAVIGAQCTFGNETLINPVDLRASLFQQGPVTDKPDLFTPTTRAQVLQETAASYGVSVEQIETALFADLAEEQILLDTSEAPTPKDLIVRYNLELARGLLYWAREVRLQVYDGYKDLFKYIKLFKLMYSIEALDKTDPTAGYHITLYGPISPFVKSSIRYGVQFAKFLPALLLCKRWQMEADVHPPNIPRNEPLHYSLDDKTKLRSHFKASGLFDSKLEADFAAEFEEKYEKAKRKWELAREDELIIIGDTVMIPDFSFTHRKDNRRALLEIVGFWHPKYLQRKLRKVQQAKRHDLILLVYQDVNVAEDVFEAVSAGEVLFFTRKPVLKEVLAAVERAAVAPIDH